MKLERVGDNQIRCTLTRDDLQSRQLKLSELAYGSEKAKSLFRDMMQKASYELGFNAENTPLMIEAVPVSADSIILIITKVEDPEELDTRFANFAPSVHDSENADSVDSLIQSITNEAGNVLDLFKRFKQNQAEKEDNPVNEIPAEGDQSFELTAAYSFGSLDEVTKVSKLLENFYSGQSSLYKNENDGSLILVINKSNHTPEEFTKVCNIISEYGNSEKFTGAASAYLEEHGDLIIKDNALITLSTL